MTENGQWRVACEPGGGERLEERVEEAVRAGMRHALRNAPYGSGAEDVDEAVKVIAKALANDGGLVVLLTDGEASREFGRVGYVRRHSKNPTRTFKSQLREVLAEAQEAADVLNDAEAGARKARAEADAKVSEVLAATPEEGRA